MIDLRSDTVTKPTPAMRSAMVEAALGDDVFGEDPTVNALEREAARRLGKEAALLVTSGTMGNLIALLTHARPGDEAIVGDRSHTVHYEGGGMAAIAGVQPRIVATEADGTLDPDVIAAAVRPDFATFARSRLICLESTHNVCDGVPLRPAYMARVRAVADQNGLAVHLDGARLFNAATALGVPVADLAADADSVTFCLSKGLSAPVGSVLCGSAEFVAEGRRARKRLGGGMRQAGVLAAAGLVALETMTERLVDDHAHARRLAVGLHALRGIACDPARVHTNIVYIDVTDPSRSPTTLAESLAQHDVRVLPSGPRTLRAVTHAQIDSEDIDRTVQAFSDALA